MITYRKASEDDMDFLLKLRESALREHVEAAGIVYDEAEQRKRLLEGFEFAYIILYNNNEAGILKVDDSSSLWKIVDFQLLPEYRKLEIEEKTLDRVISGAKDHAVDLTVSLYERDGITELFKTKKFKVIGKDGELNSLYYSSSEVLEFEYVKNGSWALGKVIKSPQLCGAALAISLVITFWGMLGDNPFSRFVKSIELFNSSDGEMAVFVWFILIIPVFLITINIFAWIRLIIYKLRAI